jgi:hypothetical protein
VTGLDVAGLVVIAGQALGTGTTAVVVEALASGRLAPAGAAAWLMPRLSPRPEEGAMHAIQRGLMSTAVLAEAEQPPGDRAG